MHARVVLGVGKGVLIGRFHCIRDYNILHRHTGRQSSKSAAYLQTGVAPSRLRPAPPIQVDLFPLHLPHGQGRVCVCVYIKKDGVCVRRER